MCFQSRTAHFLYQGVKAHTSQKSVALLTLAKISELFCCLVKGTLTSTVWPYGSLPWEYISCLRNEQLFGNSTSNTKLPCCMQTWQKYYRGYISSPVISRLRTASHSVFLNSLFVILNHEIFFVRHQRETALEHYCMEPYQILLTNAAVNLQNVNSSIHILQLKKSLRNDTTGSLFQQRTSD